MHPQIINLAGNWRLTEPLLLILADSRRTKGLRTDSPRPGLSLKASSPSPRRSGNFEEKKNTRRGRTPENFQTRQARGRQAFAAAASYLAGGRCQSSLARRPLPPPMQCPRAAGLKIRPSTAQSPIAPRAAGPKKHGPLAIAGALLHIPLGESLFSLFLARADRGRGLFLLPPPRRGRRLPSRQIPRDAQCSPRGSPPTDRRRQGAPCAPRAARSLLPPRPPPPTPTPTPPPPRSRPPRMLKGPRPPRRRAARRRRRQAAAARAGRAGAD